MNESKINVFETENLRVKYTRGRSWFTGEMRGEKQIVYTVNVIEEMTFKKPVVYLYEDELQKPIPAIDRELIAAAKHDFWENVKREIFPSGMPIGSHPCTITPILYVKLPPIKWENQSDKGNAKRIVLALMNLLPCAGEIPDDTDMVSRIAGPVFYYGDEPMIEHIAPQEIDGNYYQVEAMPRLESVVSEYETEIAKNN